MSTRLPITDATAFPLLALADAQRVANRVRIRSVVGSRMQAANQAFLAAIQALSPENSR